MFFFISEFCNFLAFLYSLIHICLILDYSFEKRMRKKKGIFIAVAGIDQEIITTLTTEKGFFNWANIELVESILYAHDDNDLGGVKNDEKNDTSP